MLDKDHALINETLSSYNGGTAHIQGYIDGPYQFIIRLESLDKSRSIEIICKDVTFFCGPTSWSNCQLEVVYMSRSMISLLIDVSSRVVIQCQGNIYLESSEVELHSQRCETDLYDYDHELQKNSSFRDSAQQASVMKYNRTQRDLLIVLDCLDWTSCIHYICRGVKFLCGPVSWSNAFICAYNVEAGTNAILEDSVHGFTVICNEVNRIGPFE